MSKIEFRNKRAKLEDVVPLSAPFSIYLDPCGACNFECSFCPCNHSDFEAAERHKTMDWKLFKKISDDLKCFQGEIKVVNLFGFGEPLLNPHIADMVRELKSNRICREVRIATNGPLLNERLSAELIDAGVDLIRISVEALSSEGYRELCGSGVAFSEIIKNTENFYKISRGTNSKISAKIISATLKDKGNVDRFNELFSSITDYHYIEAIEEYWPEFRLQQADERVKNIPATYKCRLDSDAREICSFPFTDMLIWSNGLVGACCVDWKYKTKYGDARQERVFDIWNGKNHLAFQRMHLTGNLSAKNPFCAACTRKAPDPIEDPLYIYEKLNNVKFEVMQDDV